MTNDEKTQYDETPRGKNDEQTAMDNNNQVHFAEKKEKNKKGRYAAGLAGAAAVGAGATILSGFTTKNAATEQVDSEEADRQEASKEIPAWSDGEVAVAHGNYDDMSFSEAFAAARAEVGPGGAFEWHGKVYGTYLRDEWQNMTAVERADYESHFRWNSHSSSSNDNLVHNETATNDNQNEDVTVEETGLDDEVPVVEVIGVTHDDEMDANIAVVSVDDNEVVLVDVDDDESFDVMVADVNGDGSLSENEMFDIRENNITVSDLGGFTEPHEPEPVMYGCPTTDFHEITESEPTGFDVDSLIS